MSLLNINYGYLTLEYAPFFWSNQNFNQNLQLKHQTSNNIYGNSIGPNKTITPPFEIKFNPLSNRAVWRHLKQFSESYLNYGSYWDFDSFRTYIYVIRALKVNIICTKLCWYYSVNMSTNYVWFYVSDNALWLSNLGYNFSLETPN